MRAWVTSRRQAAGVLVAGAQNVGLAADLHLLRADLDRVARHGPRPPRGGPERAPRPAAPGTPTRRRAAGPPRPARPRGRSRSSRPAPPARRRPARARPAAAPRGRRRARSRSPGAPRRTARRSPRRGPARARARAAASAGSTRLEAPGLGSVTRPASPGAAWPRRRTRRPAPPSARRSQQALVAAAVRLHQARVAGLVVDEHARLALALHAPHRGGHALGEPRGAPDRPLALLPHGLDPELRHRRLARRRLLGRLPGSSVAPGRRWSGGSAGRPPARPAPRAGPSASARRAPRGGLRPRASSCGVRERVDRPAVDLGLDLLGRAARHVAVGAVDRLEQSRASSASSPERARVTPWKPAGAPAASSRTAARASAESSQSRRAVRSGVSVPAIRSE